MTVSNVDTFQQSCDEIIADALTNVGAIGPGGTPAAKQRAHAFRALNRVVKGIDASGDFLWRTVRRDVAVTAGTASYVLGADVLGLEDPCNFRLTGANNRAQVYMMSLDDFMRLGDRTSQGTPTQYLVERTLTTFTVTLWPVPNANGTLETLCALRAKDFVVGTDTPDYTSKWTTCLILGTSAEIAPAYAQDPTSFQARFEAERDRLLNDDNEKGDMTFVAWGAGSSY